MARAPWLVVGVWLATLVLALPLALVLRGEIGAHLGASLAAQAAADGVNYDWWNEFLAQTAGVGQTFVPAILGFAAVLKNLSAVADAHGAADRDRAGRGGAASSLSMFLAGGVLDRLARDRAIGAAASSPRAASIFFRFLRLGVIAGIVYWVLFAWLHPLAVRRGSIPR